MKKLMSEILITVVVVIFAACNTAIPQVGIGTKNIVLVHGAYADGSGWEGVFNILKSRGYNVSIVQNPLISLEDDVAATERIIEKQDGPVVLVGHSWGGSVITQAGVSSKVASLVYVAAFAPTVGESTLDLIKQAAPSPENGTLPPDEKGLIYYDKAKFRPGFAADVSQEKTDFMFASQIPIHVKSFITPLTQAAWKTKPSFAIVATDDKSISPDLERTMYKRAGSKITEVKSSHVVYISNAKAVADVIEAAAKSN
jgi:pimeloyl-ACP methyl ester carboxylesterase